MAKTTHDIDKAYVSPYDEFLFRYDYTHPKTASQIKEIKKHERIFELRDNAVAREDINTIWDEF